MSSHASVLIRDQHREVWLYRHADGYPAACGDDVVAIVARVCQSFPDMPSASDVANEFLRIVRPAAADGRVRPVYEMTDGRYFIEDCYLVDLTQRTIGYAGRPLWASDQGNTEDWTAAPPRYTVVEFARCSSMPSVRWRTSASHTSNVRSR
jgi:hypothetical protein